MRGLRTHIEREGVAVVEMVHDFDSLAGIKVSERVRKAIDLSMSQSERSIYAQENKIGVSDIGTCREYVRRTIVGEPWSDEQENFAAAFTGTAVGALAEIAAAKHIPGAQTQFPVIVELTVRGFSLSLPGHVDVFINNTDYDSDESDEVWDFKTKDGLGVVKRTGPDLQQLFQVTLYAKALIDMGKVRREGLLLSLVFIDRSGAEPEPYTFSWAYDEAVLQQAIDWLDDVIYAVENKEEASKDMPRNWCEMCCPRVTACRGGDTDVSGLIDDPIVKKAVEVLLEAKAVQKAAKKDEASAKSVLEGLVGSTGEHLIRWTTVPESDIPATTRREYKRLNVTPIKKGKS